MRRAREIFAKCRSFAFREVFDPKNFGSGGDQTAALFPFGIRRFVSDACRDHGRLEHFEDGEQLLLILGVSRHSVGEACSH